MRWRFILLGALVGLPGLLGCVFCLALLVSLATVARHDVAWKLMVIFTMLALLVGGVIFLSDLNLVVAGLRGRTPSWPHA
jgi:hypothetical protein